jgi:hypothetical protein
MFDYLTEKLWEVQITPTVLAEIKAHEEGKIKSIPVSIKELRRESRLTQTRSKRGK